MESSMENKQWIWDLTKRNLVVYPWTNLYIIIEQWTVEHEIGCAELGVGQVVKRQQDKQITICVVPWQSANIRYQTQSQTPEKCL